MNDMIQANQTIIDVVMSDISSAEALNQAFASSFDEHAKTTVGKKLFARWLETPLGAMLAVADDKALHMLEFFDRRALAGEIKRLVKRTKAVIIPGTAAPLIMLEQELKQYFLGSLQHFKTPVIQDGTPFQMAAWSALREIPYGETRSYQEQAAIIGKPAAHRAVANANGCNQIAVVFPCHRIIKSDGSLGGYGGKLSRKRWLLDLEQGKTRDYVA